MHGAGVGVCMSRDALPILVLHVDMPTSRVVCDRGSPDQSSVFNMFSPEQESTSDIKSLEYFEEFFKSP